VAGNEAPKPVIIRGWLTGDLLMVELALFGWGIAWRDEASTAMLDALTTGIALRPDRRQRVPVQVLDLAHSRTGFVDPPPGRPSCAIIDMRSPLTIRRRNSRHAEPPALLFACARRVNAMARWQGAQLMLDEAALAKTIAALDIDSENWLRHRWARHSRNQGDQPIAMEGWTGRLVFRGDLGALAPLIQLAATCNIGTGAALGLGWFDAVVV
jgi:CRISPR-associated endoribonuclease Cas6